MNSHPSVSINRSETFRMHSKHVGDEFQIMVRLPFTYALAPEQKFPTLYVTDGDDAVALVSGILHMGLLDQALPEMILVAIGYGADAISPGNQRSRDLPPTQAKYLEIPGYPLSGQVMGGGGPNFLRFIQEELIPHIESNYRADPSDRAYGGISWGGVFGLYTLFNQPGIFSRYMIGSPALWWDDRITLKYEQEYAQAHNDLPARLYLSVGADEEALFPPARMVSNVHELAEMLKSRNYPSLHFKTVEEEGGHTTSQPAAYMKGLKYIFAKGE
jgi:predicted alpha/beta superfamily hydrolase